MQYFEQAKIQGDGRRKPRRPSGAAIGTMALRWQARFRVGSDSWAQEIAMAGLVADALTQIWDAEDSELFIADHEHENLGEGSSSVAWEGGVDEWAILFPDTPQARELGDKYGIWFEPILGCILAVHKQEV